MDNKTFKETLIQRSTDLSKKTLKLIDKFPNKQSSRIISSQLLRAVTSIAANIIEAQAGSSRKDFTNFLNHSLKSANESVFWFNLSKDLDGTMAIEIDKLSIETEELAKILGSTLIKLKYRKL